MYPPSSPSRFRLLPGSPPFLAATRSEHPCAVLIGAPLDLTESFRAGTAEAPHQIRVVSDVLETYSPELDLDLSDSPFADWGNIDLTSLSIEAALDHIADAVGLASRSALPILLGGEHTATLGAIRGLLPYHPDLMLVHADAHTDLREDYESLRLSHATVVKRIADLIGIDHIAQFGIRSGTRAEFQLARGCIQSGSTLEILPRVRQRLLVSPVYVSIDIDVLDPSAAPGTGCTEPGGVTFSALLQFVHSLRGLNVVGFDVMEVLPAADVNDISSVAAAKLVREAILLFGRPTP